MEPLCAYYGGELRVVEEQRCGIPKVFSPLTNPRHGGLAAGRCQGPEAAVSQGIAGWLQRQKQRLGWRIRVLLRPDQYLIRDRRFGRAGETAVGRTLVSDAHGLSARERLSLVTPFRSQRPLLDLLLLKRLRSDAVGRLYFHIGDEAPRIHIGAVADRHRPDYMAGALLILREFVAGPDFFTREVDVKPGDVVLDLGANIGTSALILSPRAGAQGRVYSFEPIFHELLRRNVEENGLHNVRVVEKAVGDRPGSATFSVTEKGIDSRMAGEGATGSTRSVEVTTIDAFVEENGLDRVDFIKADIEGAEELAIEGAREVIARFRPKWSVASYHTNPAGRPQHDGIVRLLREAGYTVRELEKRHVYAW